MKRRNASRLPGRERPHPVRSHGDRAPGSGSRRGGALTTRFEQRLERASVTVVGAGRAGSYACLALAMAGIRRLRVYDDDRLDPARNLGAQLYCAADVHRRRPKVEALAHLLRELCPWTEVEGTPARFPEGAAGPSGPIVVLGVDTMGARRHAADALKHDASLLWLVDIRLGGTVLRCHSVAGRRRLAEYRAALYGDADTWSAPCADSPDPHVALAAAAVATASVMAFLRGKGRPGEVVMEVGSEISAIR